jgi:hypothetical protein
MGVSLSPHVVLLTAVPCPAGGSQEFLVRASYLEIYNEEIRDLLSKNPQARLDLKEHPERGVYVKDLMQFVVKSVAEINSVLQVGHPGVEGDCAGLKQLFAGFGQ